MDKKNVGYVYLTGIIFFIVFIFVSITISNNDPWRPRGQIVDEEQIVEIDFEPLRFDGIGNQVTSGALLSSAKHNKEKE